MKSLLPIILFLCFGPIGHAQQRTWCEAAGVADRSQAQEFLSKLQRAVAGDDRSTVISMVGFPVGYSSPGGPIQLDQNDFEKRYDEILNDRTRRIVSDQKIQDVYCDTLGLAVGHGEIWFAPARGEEKLQITHFYLSKYSRAGVESMADTELMDDLFSSFQNAVNRNDHRTVASMLEYPLRVRTNAGSITVRTQLELIKKFDSVFNDAVRRRLAATRLNDLFATNDGIATKRGIVWFRSPTPDRKWQPKVYAIVNTE